MKNTQLRKGVMELCVLRVLKQGEAYTSDIGSALMKADMLVVEGTLYPLLARLKNAGHLKYRWEESKSGPPRKYYSLSAKGERLLGELDAEWNQFIEQVNSL